MNPNIIYIALSLLYWGIGEGMFFNFVPIYLNDQFQMSETQIGFILGAFGATMAVTHMPSGYLADKIGRKPLLVFAWLIGLFSTVAMGMTLNLNIFLIGFAGYGITAFVASPLSSYVTAARGEWSVGKALSLTSATFNIGMAIGPLLGGWIGVNYGMRSSYFWAAGAFLISTVFMLSVKRQPIDKHDPEAPPISLWKNRRFISFMGMLAFAVFAMYLAQPLTPNFLEGVRNFKLNEIGWIFSAGALGNALFAVYFSQLNPRYGFIYAQMSVVLFALIMWKGLGLPLFMFGYFLLGGFRAARAMAMAQGRELIHGSQMGLMYGTMETAYAVIFIIAPPLAGWLFVIDPFLVYPLAIGLLAISLIVTYMLSIRKAQHA